MIETTTYGISPKGVAASDQLWAMAEDGKSLRELGESLRSFVGPEADQFSAQDFMEFAVLTLAASLGVRLSV